MINPHDIKLEIPFSMARTKQYLGYKAWCVGKINNHQKTFWCHRIKQGFYPLRQLPRGSLIKRWIIGSKRWKTYVSRDSEKHVLPGVWASKNSLKNKRRAIGKWNKQRINQRRHQSIPTVSKKSKYNDWSRHRKWCSHRKKSPIKSQWDRQQSPCPSRIYKVRHLVQQATKRQENAKETNWKSPQFMQALKADMSPTPKFLWIWKTSKLTQMKSAKRWPLPLILIVQQLSILVGHKQD